MSQEEMMRNVNFVLSNIGPEKIVEALKNESDSAKVAVFVEAILETFDAESIYKASILKSVSKEMYLDRFYQKLVKIKDEKYLCKFAYQFKFYLTRKQVEKIADLIIASENGKYISTFILNVSQNIRMNEMKEAVYKYCDAKQLLEVAKHVYGYDMNEVAKRILETKDENLIEDYCDVMKFTKNDFYNKYLDLYIEEE